MDYESIELAVDRDYANRDGYDDDFLAVRVPLPDHPDDAEAVALTDGSSSGVVLKYVHFSIVMSERRRLAYYVATNVDGERIVDLGPRGSDYWVFDTRIPQDAQIGDWGYDGNDFDRGHLVRRLDPVWGDSEEEARRAEADTFHFTNCAPQHSEFNRSKRLWQGIETYILDNADVHDLRVAVFTGPVLLDDDPEIHGMQVPRDYWKVVAMVRESGDLAAAAYRLSQDDLLQRMVEEFVFGPYKTFQVAVPEIEEVTGLSFGDLRGADVLVPLIRAERVPERIELTRLDDMVL